MNSSPAHASPSSAWELLIAPYARLRRSGMALLTAATLLLGLAASRFGIRFDGFLDLHRSSGGTPVPLSTALADQFVALPLSALVAWLILRAFGASTPLVLLLLILGTLRLPLVLSAAVVLAGPDPAAVLTQQPVAPTPMLLLVGLAAVLGFAWTVTLLVTGVRFATDLRGGRLAGAVLSVVLAAEILSKLALVLLT